MHCTYINPKSVTAWANHMSAISCTLGLFCLNASVMTSGPMYSSEADSAMAVKQLLQTDPFFASPSLSTSSEMHTSHEVLRKGTNKLNNKRTVVAYTCSLEQKSHSHKQRAFRGIITNLVKFVFSARVCRAVTFSLKTWKLLSLRPGF